MNLCFGICFVAVFLGEVVTQDLSCIGQVLSAVNPVRFYRDGASVCENFKDGFERVHYDIKKCTRHEIDLTKLNSLHEDFCNTDSDFSQEFQRFHKCFLEKTGDSSSCYDQWMKNGRNLTKEKCDSLTAGVFECLGKNVLENCGDSALKVFKRLNEAQEPVFELICVELSSAVGRSLFTWLILVATIIAVTWFQG